VADILENLHWFHGEPTSLALMALTIVAFALITAFAAAIGLRHARKPALLAPGDGMPGDRLKSTSTPEALDAGDDETARPESKTRLHRRASILGRRFRKGRRIRDNLLFLSRFASAPTKVGSITPSSRDLGRAMAAELPDEYSICVELGGGTGSLTSALLAAGVPRDKLIVIERDPRLVAHLRKRFPKVTIVEGDAQHLRRILAEAGIDHVDAVISGLPLRNLPGAVRRNIATEVFAALEFGGVFVQFTYWGKPPVPGEVARRYGVGSEKTRRVWRNMPPANVWRYERRASPG
jgi:phosphatidylethanolamine/phosphatidyl-N-methylethanolamine N-methyltransferase